MADKNAVYKMLELTGTSTKSCDDAVQNAITRASKTVRNMRWFEVTETRGAIEQAGAAVEKIGNLADTTNGVLADNVKPTIANLNQTISAARKSMETLDATIGDARPGLQTFSKKTVPEVDQLVQDLRETAIAFGSIAQRLDQGGASSLLGAPQLPDYKAKK